MTGKQGSRRNQDVRPSRQPFFPFYADDWIAGTIGLTFEQRGFYIAVLAAIWSRRAAIPVEQIPMAVICDKRVAARLLPQLIDLGKLHLDAANRVYNTRLNRLLQVTSEVGNSCELPPDFPETSAELPAEVREKSGNIFPEKPTKSMEPRARDRDHIHIHSQKEEKDTPLAPSESVAASGPEIGALNGSTTTILNTVAVWANNLTPEIDTARRIVTSHVGTFGADAVRRGFADLQTDIASGKLISNPLKAFAGYCDRAKRNSLKLSANGVPYEGDRATGFCGSRAALTKHDRLKLAIAESNRQLGIGPDPGSEGSAGAVELCGSVLRGPENLWEGT